MKHQYFGDVNDFKKYGILRGMVDADLRLLVAWMLTAEDGRSDGKFIEYLKEPSTWREFDPELFDFLSEAVLVREERSVHLIEEWDGLPASFLSSIVPDDRDGRIEWESSLRSLSGEHDLVFFDPDNGIEVASRPIGRKDSGKYVRWAELEAAWASGASLLIYQHFPRVPRDEFIAQMSDSLRRRLSAPHIGVLRTPRVAFFLVPQERWAEDAFQRAATVADSWEPHVRFVMPDERS